MTLYTFENSIPEINETSFVAPNASLIGQVMIGENSSVWFNTVLRGDMETITIGHESNIQDLSMGTRRSRISIGFRKQSNNRAPLCIARV